MKEKRAYWINCKNMKKCFQFFLSLAALPPWNSILIPHQATIPSHQDTSQCIVTSRCRMPGPEVARRCLRTLLRTNLPRRHSSNQCWAFSAPGVGGYQRTNTFLASRNCKCIFHLTAYIWHNDTAECIPDSCFMVPGPVSAGRTVWAFQWASWPRLNPVKYVGSFTPTCVGVYVRTF